MPRRTSIISALTPVQIISALGAIVLALAGIAYADIRGSISDLKTEQTATTSAISDDRIETVRAIGDVRLEVSGVRGDLALTNQKLDQLIVAVRAKNQSH